VNNRSDVKAKKKKQAATRWRGRRRKQPLDNFKEKSGHGKMKEE